MGLSFHLNTCFEATTSVSANSTPISASLFLGHCAQRQKLANVSGIIVTLPES